MTIIKKYFSTGGRKKASAQVILKPGKGYFIVNEKNGILYFQKSLILLKKIFLPLNLLKLNQSFDIIVKIKGSGLTAQAEAIRLGITKILSRLNVKFRLFLKKYKLLRRDPRKVERKKYGLHKARKAAQYSKR
jgi:small subunit ribosomal protein S9